MKQQTPIHISESLLMAGLKRHVRICDAVLNSSAFLSSDDRVQIMQNLLEAKGNPSINEIEAVCTEWADDNLSFNMVKARLQSNRY